MKICLKKQVKISKGVVILICEAKEYYQRRINKYNKLIEKEEKHLKNIIMLRLLTVILGAVCLITTYLLRQSYIFLFIILIIITLVTFFGYTYEKIKNKKESLSIFYYINKSSIDRLNGKWNSFKDTGGEFIDENHNYSYDLDIFGNNSLFQWTNTCNTYMGRLRLKRLFTEMPKDKEDIYERQEAVEELASKAYFRQRLEAEGKRISNNKQNLKELFSWMKEKDKIIKSSTITNIKIGRAHV